MEEFLKAIKHFVLRDVVYIIAGGSVVVSFLYTFDQYRAHKNSITKEPPNTALEPTATSPRRFGSGRECGHARIPQGLSWFTILLSNHIRLRGNIVFEFIK